MFYLAPLILSLSHRHISLYIYFSFRLLTHASSNQYFLFLFARSKIFIDEERATRTNTFAHTRKKIA